MMPAQPKTSEDRYPELDTPAVVIDLDRLELNIEEMTQTAREGNLKLRPHVKVHQCPEIAKMQVDAGACGVEVGNVEQAMVMVSGGIQDLIIAHPFVGRHKIEKLEALLKSSDLKLGVVVDMFEQAQALSQLAKKIKIAIPLYIKIDTGINRFGVSPGEAALKLAQDISRLAGVLCAGIYAHESGAIPTQEGVDAMAHQVAGQMCETAALLRNNGIHITHVSVGASPTFRSTCRYTSQHRFPEITEIHPGACVVGDITYESALGVSLENCALSVLTGVMSTSHENHGVIDAGFKTLGADPIFGCREKEGYYWNGMPSYGLFRDRPDLWLGKLGAESGWLYYREAGKRLATGQRLEIVPNNATLVLNLHDKAYGVRNGVIERVLDISGRGKGS